MKWPFTNFKNPTDYNIGKVHNFYIDVEANKIGVWYVASSIFNPIIQPTIFDITFFQKLYINLSQKSRFHHFSRKLKVFGYKKKKFWIIGLNFR